MLYSSLRKLAAAALALAMLTAAPAAQAQALHPLPPDFLATLKDIDTSSDEIAASVQAIKTADLTYSMFSRRRAEDAIARIEQQMPALKTQTASLRREESLRVLLSMRTAFADAQRNVGSVSDILHGVTVRTPAQADELDRLLARLDGATGKLDAALNRFDSAAVALTARAAPAVAQAQAPASAGAMAPASPAQAQASAPGGQPQAPAASGSAQTPGAPAAAQPQAMQSLSPAFLATLKEIDTASDDMAASATAIRNADLTYSMFSRRRAEDAIARVEKQVPSLKMQTAGLRREPSLGMLLSTRTAFSEVQRNIGSVSDILHGVTVRTPMQADELDRLLVRLDGASTRLGAALKQFDAGALVIIDSFDKPAGKP